MTNVKKTYRDYSSSEEILNIITHGIGIALGIAGLVFLILKGLEKESALYMTAFLIYGITLIWTYTTSTVYHSLFKIGSVKIKNAFHLLDHTAIYLFIAGTYTPVALFALPSGWNVFILTSIWVLAVLGVVFKIFSIGKWLKLSTVLYLLMGWMIIIAVKPLIETAPAPMLWWVLAGGISYSIGTIFFMMNRLKYSHALWHLFVLGDSICHYVAIYVYL